MLHALDDLHLNQWCHTLGWYLMMTYDDVIHFDDTWWIHTLDEGWKISWWWCGRSHLMVGRLFWSSPNDAALWHIIALLLNIWSIPSWWCWILSWWHGCHTWWHYNPRIDKTSKGESKQLKRHVVLFTSYTQKLRTVTKKNCFYHLGGILSTCVPYHLVEYIFPVLMSLYFPRNSQRLRRYGIFKSRKINLSSEPTYPCLHVSLPSEICALSVQRQTHIKRLVEAFIWQRIFGEDCR